MPLSPSAPHPRQPRQHPTTQFFTGRMPFLIPNQQCQSTEGILWDWKSWTNKVLFTLFILKNMFLYCCNFDFLRIKVSKGKVRTLNRWGAKLNHVSMAYLLSNICTKNDCNWITNVKIIIGGYIFFETQCISQSSIFSLKIFKSYM